MVAWSNQTNVRQFDFSHTVRPLSPCLALGFSSLILHNRLATGSKHLNLFIREEQAKAFAASYKTLDVHTTTLRNLGNFKGALLGSVRKIHGISKPRAFQLLKDGDQQMTVGMKEFMHHELHTGLTREGVFTGPPHDLFVGGIPKVEDAPPFELKALDDKILDKIQQRYDCVHQRLKALYPDGEKRCPS